MLQDKVLAEMMRIFGHPRNVPILEHILSIRTPTVDALAEILFSAAVCSGNTEIASLLLKFRRVHNISTSSFGYIQRALKMRNVKLVRLLVNAGVDVNDPADVYCWETALQAAAKVGSLELVQILLNAGADVNAPAADDAGRTVLQAAAEGGYLEVVQMLLTAGAEVDAVPPNYTGETALRFSAIKGFFGIAMILLNAGADVNAPAALREEGGALERAAEHGRADMVQLLLDAGAGDTLNKLALERASNRGHHATVTLIKTYYASLLHLSRE